MRIHVASVSGTILAILCAGMAFADQSKIALTGQVLDSEGAAIPGATVIIHWDPSGSAVGLHTNVGIKEDVRLQTGKHGDFSVQLPPGFYDIFVSAMAFSPACRKIRLKDEKVSKFQVELRVDPLVTDELGTQIFQSPDSTRKRKSD
jgi:hypothetical protein